MPSWKQKLMEKKAAEEAEALAKKKDWMSKLREKNKKAKEPVKNKKLKKLPEWKKKLLAEKQKKELLDDDQPEINDLQNEKQTQSLNCISLTSDEKKPEWMAKREHIVKRDDDLHKSMPASKLQGGMNGQPEWMSKFNKMKFEKTSSKRNMDTVDSALDSMEDEKHQMRAEAAAVQHLEETKEEELKEFEVEEEDDDDEEEDDDESEDGEGIAVASSAGASSVATDDDISDVDDVDDEDEDSESEDETVNLPEKKNSSC